MGSLRKERPLRQLFYVLRRSPQRGIMEHQYFIKGGNPLVGSVEIGGAKNSALGILAAAIMGDETVTIRNLPDVNDINVFINAIKSIGAQIVYPNPNDRHIVMINGRGIRNLEVDNEYIRQIRASYYLIGALLGKYKEAAVALPGGCNIGARPIDQHQKGFKALGADIKIDKGMIYARADKLVGKTIYLDVVSVGATINIMLAASMAEGKTIIENAAKEPHVVDVAQFLNQMGADIRGAGTGRIRINGVKKFKAADHEIIPDQIEAGTFRDPSAPGGYHSKASGYGSPDRGDRRRHPGCCSQASWLYDDKDHASPGLPDRYAVSVCCLSGTCLRQFPGDGEDIREPFPVYWRACEDGRQHYRGRHDRLYPGR